MTCVQGENSEWEPWAHRHPYAAGVCVCESLSRVWLFVAQGLYPARLLCPWDPPGKNTGVGCQDLLQGIFPTQGLNSSLFSCIGRRVLYL